MLLLFLSGIDISIIFVMGLGEEYWVCMIKEYSILRDLI